MRGYSRGVGGGIGGNGDGGGGGVGGGRSISDPLLTERSIMVFNEKA